MRSEFFRLTKDDPGMDSELRLFLARSYNLKATADYEIGPGAEIPPDRAASAFETATRFVAQVATVLA